MSRLKWSRRYREAYMFTMLFLNVFVLEVAGRTDHAVEDSLVAARNRASLSIEGQYLTHSEVC